MAIKDWPGGVVTDIPVEPSGNYEDSAASGVWTLDQVADYVKQDLWPTPGNVDPSKYVDALFSTYLYTGNGGTEQAIVNNVDLLNEGGLVWIKERANAGTESHQLFDTERGSTYSLHTDTTDGNSNYGTAFKSFNSDGFSVQDSGYAVNDLNATYASWTFRKKEKFFDIVSGLTSDGSGNLPEFNHSLGSTPGCVIMKATDSGSNWVVYHNGLSGGGANQYIQLNQTNAATNATGFGIATDTTFEVGAGSALVPDVTYVAYLFASDAGGFGDDGSESIIKCGSFTGASDVNLGYEPQWILLKRSSGVNDWWIFDTMRGWLAGSDTASVLKPNLSNAELSTGFDTKITSTGFTTALTGTYIYIAIRRPMKTPTAGTEVFNPDLADASVAPLWESPFPVDLGMYAKRDSSTATFYAGTRLTGTGRLSTWDTAAEVTDGSFKWDYMDGWFNNAFTDSQYLGYGFKRATGFFDVVAYTGNGSVTTQAHNLGVVPELMIVKRRSTAASWYLYVASLGADKEMILNSTLANQFDGAFLWDSTNPTSSVFTLGADTTVNGTGSTYIAYLFATLAGVSKVGSYTGTAADLNVDCGFSAGARFILIKRTDDTGDWYVWDSARGIVAGNDPYLLLNSTAAEVTGTDYIDPLSSGFTVTSSAPAALNASGGTYIFLAIA